MPDHSQKLATGTMPNQSLAYAIRHHRFFAQSLRFWINLFYLLFTGPHLSSLNHLLHDRRYSSLVVPHLTHRGHHSQAFYVLTVASHAVTKSQLPETSVTPSNHGYFMTTTGYGLSYWPIECAMVEHRQWGCCFFRRISERETAARTAARTTGIVMGNNSQVSLHKRWNWVWSEYF